MVKDVPDGATVVGLAGRVLERHVSGQPPITARLSESRGDHDVRVIEVLLEKVEALESCMVDSELSAHEDLPARSGAGFEEDGGI